MTPIWHNLKSLRKFQKPPIEPTPLRQPTKKSKLAPVLNIVAPEPLQGVVVDAFGKSPANTPLTQLSTKTRANHEIVSTPAIPGQPAALALSFHAGDLGDMLLEVVDDLQDRSWTEDERQMVSEVAGQLALALENARLFKAAQQELAERERAEKIILQNNQDLSTLNQSGQRLSHLSSRGEIFSVVAELVEQVMDSTNYYLCLREQSDGMITFPLYVEDGLPMQIPARPEANELSDFILNMRKPLLISAKTDLRLKEFGVDLPRRIPTAILAVPMSVGETISGSLVVQHFAPRTSDHFDEAHLELLSTAVSQASTALENTSLFEQMQLALQAIEKRERYQGGVAQAAGHLSEFGSESLKDVLQYVGQAGQANRVYLLEYQAKDPASHWKLIKDWLAPDSEKQLHRAKIETVAYEVFSNQVNTLRARGWVEIQASQDQTATGAFLREQNIATALILQVPSKDPIPNILVFDQMDAERHWSGDEINILHVAADAISNTFVREDLLSQLRLSLEETESLYKATSQFVLAGDFQEMLAVLMSTVNSRGLNRALMVLFERDDDDVITEMTIHANWYNGAGTQPLYVGSLLPIDIYESFLHTTTPVFLESTINPALDRSLRALMYEQNIHSLVMLPMWNSKHQIGSVLIEGEHKHPFTGRETRILPPLAAQLTIAVENLHLVEQTQAAFAETNLLYSVSSGIAAAQSADEMVQLVVDNVLPRGADKAAMMLAELDERDEISDMEIVGFLDTYGISQLKGMRLRIDRDLPVMHQLTEDGLVITDTELIDATSQATFNSCGVKGITFVPMRSGGRLVGLLSASCRNPIHFNAGEIRVLRTVANGIAVALEKQRLLREAQRRALELQTASEIARDTTSTLSLDLLLNRIVNLLCERFGYYHTSIYFIDEARTYAVLREASGEIGSELKRSGHHLAIGSKSIIGYVSANGETLVTNDVNASPLYVPHPLLPETHAEMTLPLRIGSQIIGVLDIQTLKAHAFTKEDANVLSILTDQIAIAIENARAYELAQQAIEDMREVDRVKSQFLANMSHELRTPLNSIIGFSRVILKGIDGPTTETQQQDLGAIYSSGQHLLTLINDILDLSKIEAGKMDLMFSDIVIADLIASVMSTAVGLVKDKPIKLNTILPPNLPTVRADSTRVRQVLINFLSNAAKFTDHGNITVEAQTAQSPQGLPEILFTVTDSGPGIAEGDRVKLFLPFSQVDDSPTRKTGGTGLGLSICRSLIEMHNGRIGLLNSEVGKGSTFFFSLPLPTPEKVPEAVPETPKTTSSVVLSIDDDPQVISLYQRYLEPQGYAVLALTDPYQAVAAARRAQPIAITLDVMMPGRNGWLVLEDLKNDPQTRDIPVIVCSLAQEEEKGFSLGATDYLVKPFLQDELLNVLQRLSQADGIQRILVIDDDEDDLRLAEKMLSANPRFRVSLACGGEKGLKMAKDTHPNAILLDLMMPDMDGFELLTHLRADPYLMDTPVIVFSGADLTPEQHKKLTEMGKQLLSKAYLREKELLSTIEQSLKRIRTP